MSGVDPLGLETLNIEKCDSKEISKLIGGVNKEHPESHFKLAVHKYRGICVTKNEREAFWLFMVAAQNGIVEAYYNVALMYHLGVGTDQDIDRAIKMIKFLVEKDYKPAKDYLQYLKDYKNIGKK